METKKNEDQVLQKTGDDSVLNMIHEIPISEIYVNDQVRKTFDNDDLAGLAQSIKENGLIQPITVRKYLGGTQKKVVGSQSFTYELITGERRLRAHQLLKADTIRAMIQIFNKDGEVLAVQIIENLQRVDLHPMEEAWGYSQLVDVNKLSRKQIADKVGKSLSYIDKRVQLMKLFPEAQKLFRENKFSVSHAIEIARLDEVVQKKLLERMFRPYDGSYADLEQTRMLIQTEIMTDLATAVFDLKDAELVRKAGACTACNKNTGCYETLFDDMPKGKSMCTDKLCFGNKTKVDLQNKIKKAEEAGLAKISFDGGGKAAGVLYSPDYVVVKKDDKKCDSAKKAVLIKSGWDMDAGGHKERGDKITICDDPKCKVHGKKVKEAARDPRNGIQADSDKNDEKNLREFGKTLKKDIENEKFNSCVLDALSGLVNEKNFTKFFDLIIAKLFNDLDSDLLDILSVRWGIDRKSMPSTYHIEEAYKRIKGLKLNNKMEKIVQLLFINEVDPESMDDCQLMVKFAEENFKTIKVGDIKEKVAAKILDISVTDFNAIIKKCKTDTDIVDMTKKHLNEMVNVLTDSGAGKYPEYNPPLIWDGKKIVGDFYNVPAGKLLGLIEHVANYNREAAMKLHQLVMVIPDIKKSMGPSK